MIGADGVLKRSPKFSDILKPLVWIHPQCPRKHRLHPIPHLYSLGSWCRTHLWVEYPHHQIQQLLALERSPICQKLNRDNGKRIDVGIARTEPQIAKFKLFRSITATIIRIGQSNHPMWPVTSSLRQIWNTKVKDFDRRNSACTARIAIIRTHNQQVCWLDVPVRNAMRMGNRKHLGWAVQPLDYLAERTAPKSLFPSLGEDVFQGFSIEPLKHKVWNPASSRPDDFPCVEQTDHARGQFREGAECPALCLVLALKRGAYIWTHAPWNPQALDNHRVFECGMMGSIHQAEDAVGVPCLVHEVFDLVLAVEKGADEL